MLNIRKITKRAIIYKRYAFASISNDNRQNDGDSTNLIVRSFRNEPRHSVDRNELFNEMG